MDNARERLERQIEFIVEADRLKGVGRRTYVLGGERLENTAEHSWHVALMVGILAEYADRPIDPFRVTRMLLVHDLVEIDAGDTYLYDSAGNAGKRAREEAAADRLYGMLPADLGDECRALWEEFEGGETADAAFALALDRLMPLIHNVRTRGRAWQEHGIRADRVRSVVPPAVAAGSRRLGELAEEIIRDAVAQGFLPE